MTPSNPVPDQTAPAETVHTLRDLIAADPGTMTITEAEESARTLLAAHARELAVLVQDRIELDRADHPSGYDAHKRRGGMMSARQVLDRYADDLDQQAGGEQA